MQAITTGFCIAIKCRCKVIRIEGALKLLDEYVEIQNGYKINSSAALQNLKKTMEQYDVFVKNKYFEIYRSDMLSSPTNETSGYTQ